MFRLVRLRRFPRINLTICLLIYCFLGVLYLMTFSTKNQTILMTTVENYEYESKIKFSASKNSQVSKLMQTSTPPVLQVSKIYSISFTTFMVHNFLAKLKEYNSKKSNYSHARQVRGNSKNFCHSDPFHWVECFWVCCIVPVVLTDTALRGFKHRKHVNIFEFLIFNFCLNFSHQRQWVSPITRILPKLINSLYTLAFKLPRFLTYSINIFDFIGYVWQLGQT